MSASESLPTHSKRHTRLVLWYVLIENILRFISLFKFYFVKCRTQANCWMLHILLIKKTQDRVQLLHSMIVNVSIKHQKHANGGLVGTSESPVIVCVIRLTVLNFAVQTVYINLKHNRRDSQQKESNFGGRVLSIKATILNFYSSGRAVEGWGEKEICTKRVSDGQKEGEGRGWGNEKYAFPGPLPFTVDSNSESTDGRLNKRSRAP